MARLSPACVAAAGRRLEPVGRTRNSRGVYTSPDCPP